MTSNLEPRTPNTADAVVIGAGAFGFAAAYQLAALGAGSIVLLDQYEPGTQTSPKAAGLFKMMQSLETKTQLARLSREIVIGFEVQTGIPMPHVKSGSLMAARTAVHAGLVDAYAEDARSWGVSIERIEPSTATDYAAYVNPAEFRTCYWMPDDLYVEEPRSMLIAYWQAARRLGVSVIGHTPVTGIRVQNRRVTAVETPRGTIDTETVVDCAGVWSRWIGEMAGSFVPVQPMRHQLRITAPLDGIRTEMAILRLVDASAYARPSRGGLMVGNFEADPLPVDVPHGSGFTLDMVPLDPGVTGRAVAAINTAIPMSMDAPAQEERGGLFTMTADGRFLVGPDPEVQGFWMATGCNGSGFSLSSGVGRCLAEWIVGGEPPFDLAILSPSRFDQSTLSVETLRDESVRQYANYYTPFDH